MEITLMLLAGFMVLGLLAVALCLLAYLLAHWNAYYTFVPSGRMKAVMAGETFVRFIVNVPGFHREVDEQTGDLKPLAPGEKDGRSWINRWLGMYWVGFWPVYTILRYPLRWNQYVKRDDETQSQLKPRDEMTDVVIFSYPYGFSVPDIETAGNIPVKIEDLLEIEVVNPEKMLFRRALPPGSWIQRVEASNKEAVTLFGSDRDLDELRELKTSRAPGATAAATPLARDFENDMKYMNERTTERENDGITDLYGVKVVDVRFLGFEPIGEDPRRAAQAAEIARLKAQAAVEEAKGKSKSRLIEAKAEQKAREMEGLGEAAAYSAKKNALGDGEAFVAAMNKEALENTQVQVLGGNVLSNVDVKERSNRANPQTGT